MRKVEGRQDVWDTVVHPRLIGVPMVFPWGPCSRVREETGPDVHEVREGGIVVGFAPTSEGDARDAARAMSMTRSMGAMVVRYLHRGAEATTRRAAWSNGGAEAATVRVAGSIQSVCCNRGACRGPGVATAADSHGGGR